MVYLFFLLGNLLGRYCCGKLAYYNKITSIKLATVISFTYVINNLNSRVSTLPLYQE